MKALGIDEVKVQPSLEKGLKLYEKHIEEVNYRAFSIFEEVKKKDNDTNEDAEMEKETKVNEHLRPSRRLRRRREFNKSGNVTESPEARAEGSSISPQQHTVIKDKSKQPIVSDGEFHSPLIKPKYEPYTDDMFARDLPQDEPTPIGVIRPEPQNNGSGGEIGKKSSSEDIDAKGKTDGVASSPGLLFTRPVFSDIEYSKKRKQAASMGTCKGTLPGCSSVPLDTQTIIFPPPPAPDIPVQNNKSGGEFGKKSSYEDVNAKGKTDGVASSSPGYTSRRAFFSGIELRKRRKQAASKGTCEGILPGYSSVHLDPHTIIPPPPPAPAVTVAATSVNKPSLPVRVQRVLPHVEEVFHSDQVRAAWSFSGVDIPREVILQNIANSVQGTIALVNLFEACEQLKKDKEVECSKLMNEIEAVRDERNNIKAELDQLKTSSSAEIDQLKKSHNVEVDQLKAQIEQVKVDAEATRLQAIEETKDKEGEIMNNMFFQIWKHNRNADLSFLEGGETSLIEACERRLVEEKRLLFALHQSFPRTTMKEVQGDIRNNTPVDPSASQSNQPLQPESW
ncbi:uncharacterized protein LOC133784375 isoform X2 [Humulus lupulus]|uniref:uncharacterized protein LOC133784375 isoform X2 n=1 Tax=Humulus lupulus TaxID=3486 RepID=UPI002B4130E0|nr:uncharacterized protein LOC133784375 isoform X2 [Humulus lupulus]